MVLHFYKSKRFLALIWFTVFLLDFFAQTVYPFYSRHAGIFLTFYFFMLQIYHLNTKWIEIRNDYILKTTLFVFILFLVILIGSNIFQTIEDIRYPRSDSKSLSNYIQADRKYKHSVIITEQDFLAEALPYYIPNKIYIPRESVYRNYTRYTLANKDSLSMGQLILFSDTIQESTKSPVLFISKVYNPNQNKITYYNYRNKILTQTDEDRKSIIKIKSFESSIGDETYTLYEIR